MKLRNTWLRPAMALSSASAAASVAGGGSFIALVRAMARGTMPAISARRVASPITESMWLSSAAETPMCRGMNSVVFSSSPSGRADCISMEGSGVLFDEFRVVGLVHQDVELGHVLDQDLEQPAGAHRVLVGDRRVGAQVFVDFGDFAGDRHVHVGGGLDRLDHAGHLALGVGAAHLGQVHEHHVAQRVLRMQRDADDGGFVVLELYPL